MKKGWVEKTLGQVCQFEKIPKQQKGIPYVGMEDIESNTGRFLGSFDAQEVKSLTFSFSSDHVLYGRLRPYLNKVLLPEFQGHCSTEIFPLKPSSELDRNFLYHWLLSDNTVKKINATCTGARMPRANMNQVLDFPIPIPPLPEQHRIVAILDEVFNSITRAKDIAERNLRNARELFESYLKGVFANQGEGWEEKTIGESCILASGNTLNPSFEKPEGEIPYLKVADMNLMANSRLITTSSRFVNKSDINVNGLIPEGSTIFPKRGGAIFTNKKRLTSSEIWMDLNLMAVTPKQKILPEFLFYYFQNLDLREINNGSSIPQINNYSIEPLLIRYPISLTEQRRIIIHFDSLSSETKKLESIYRQKLTDLEELDKSVLQKAFNGELT